MENSTVKHINIAIDGPSGSGKSTLAKQLAKRLGLVYIDTGAIYRTIGLYVCRKGIERTDSAKIISLLPEMKIEMTLENGGNVIFLNGNRIGEEIRTSEISLYASDVSKIPEVRNFILDLQRTIAENNNCVMDGRDIGTVILPNADVKIFLSASDENRAKRRLKELLEKGESVTLEDVLKDMKWRDENDKNRKIAPAIPAEDAILFDNSELDIEQTASAAEAIIRSNIKI